MKKMNQVKTTLTLIILLIAFVNIGQSQNCYEVIAGLSGFDTSPYQAELETAACELKNAFPEEFQDQFKVYDFAFYSQNEFMQGGFQAVWDKVVSEIPSEYYLIFGKQSDKTGVYSKFWLKLNLPSSGNFECFNQTQYNLLELSILEKVNNTYSVNGNFPIYYSNSEKSAILYLKERILDMIECCQPNLRNPQSSCSGCPNELDIATYFQSQQYDEYDITIKVDDFGNPIELEPLANNSIQDYALNVYLEDEILKDPYSEIEAELNNMGSNELIVGVITNNFNLCVDPIATALRSSSSNEALDLFNNGYAIQGKKVVIVYHLWLNPDGSGQDKLYKKYLYANNGTLEEVSQALNPNNLGVSSSTIFNYPLTELDECDNTTILYEVKLDVDGKYYGYELSNCRWNKKDIVEFIHPSPYPSNPSDAQYNIGSLGYTPSKTLKTKMRKEFMGPFIEVSYNEYEPCELCYEYAVGSKKTISDNDLIKGFYGPYETGWTHQEAKDILFNSFIYGNGQDVVWNSNTTVAQDLRNNATVQSNLLRIEDEIISWVKSNGNLDGLISSNVLRDISTNPNPNFTAWDLPNLWPFQMFGGIQGRSVKIVKFKKINSPNCPTEYYQCEIIYTLFDNFGLNDDEAWYIPGLAEQWVLQHYRNGYCCNGQAFHPVTRHQVEFHHSFNFCK